MLQYDKDSDGWTPFAEQGDEFLVKEFVDINGNQVIAIINIYDENEKFVWFGEGSIKRIVNLDDNAIPDFERDGPGVILYARYRRNMEGLLQAREGFVYAPWTIQNTGNYAMLVGGEEILYKFSKETGMPYSQGLFFEEVEDDA